VGAGAPAARETPVAAQLAPQLAVLRNAPDGSQTMTVVLTPDSLGEVTVQVTVTDGTLDLMLRGASEHGRSALADALPELRRELEGAGLSFSRLAVDPDAPRDGGAGGRAAEQLLADLRGGGDRQQQGSASQRPRAWTASDTSPGEGPAPALRPSASTGVDVRV
jgi:flagellar hook-length control protein FliK